MSTKSFSQVASDLATGRGQLVSSADCGELEISTARACGRFYVTADGLGFVLRLPPPSGARLAVLHDKCSNPDCGRVLHSIREGEAGVCSSCWFKSMPKDTKAAMNRLIASAFNGSTKAEKDAAVEEAMGKLKRDG